MHFQKPQKIDVHPAKIVFWHLNNWFKVNSSINVRIKKGINVNKSGEIDITEGEKLSILYFCISDFVMYWSPNVVAGAHYNSSDEIKARAYNLLFIIFGPVLLRDSSQIGSTVHHQLTGPTWFLLARSVV
jgi:hypothetical protein